MAAAVRVNVVQGTREWLAYRRTVVTATDIPVLLGLSQYKCEADLADEKDGRAVPQPPSIAARRGKALEPLMAELYEEATGRRVRRSHLMFRHPEIEWAAASLDATASGPTVVEFKTTGSRQRFADGLPDDVAAQVAWQLGCSGWPRADVLVMVGDDTLPVFEVLPDPALFADLVTVAEDFRRRLAEGGPFARDAARIRRDHPADDGSELVADNDVDEAVRALLDVRAAIRRHEATEEQLVRAITDRMGDAALLTGVGWHATWKRSKDSVETDWRLVAADSLGALPVVAERTRVNKKGETVTDWTRIRNDLLNEGETERSALVARYTTVSPGQRPLRVVSDKED